ncbi:acyltransferase family protein [Marilutibacter aestuarii]|uniref:Acyltransferase n=1 Tax=Marilutibacter aestuarii TaxID=1706195 RepID=A0A507ZU34_9GAMM|nr:acyltransferase [Lysobacter aestuarii]TQD40939.1 acyltransferase [Lysobacter aestuarii]
MAAVPQSQADDAGLYFPSLDGFRGFAFMGIVAAHVFQLWEGVEIPWQLKLPNLLVHCAWAGIDAFFVLSGFLITGILLRLRGRERALRLFYFRRTLRIFPPYYALLLVLFAWLAWSAGDWRAPFEPARLSYWVYLHNFAISAQGWDAFRPLSHLWSLAIEEQFYLLWPLLVLMLPIGRLRWVLFGFLLFAPLLRLAMTLQGSSYVPVYVLLFTRLDALAGGALTALMAATPEGRARLGRWGPRMVAASLVVILAFYLLRHGYLLDDPLVQVVGYSVNIVGAVGVLTSLAFAPRTLGLRGFFAWSPFRWLGNRSYGGYLYHWPIAIVVHQWLLPLGMTPLWSLVDTMLLTTALTLLAAETSWRLIERPCLALRHLYPSQAKRVDIAPPLAG